MNSFDVLAKENLIFPGSIVPGKKLIEALGIKPEDKRFWCKKLELFERIQLLGYFVTERNCEDNSFRILNISEMADYALGRLERNMHSNEKTTLILKAADINCLSEENQKRHNFAMIKCARCTSLMAGELLSGIII